MGKPAKSPDSIVDYKNAPAPPRIGLSDFEISGGVYGDEYIPATFFKSLFESQMLLATGRLSIENNRLTAENDRLNDENKRLSNENARINAKYDKLYKQINAFHQSISAFEDLT